ncbi:MAG TPA: DUF4442 domain-containing protein [Thiotrichales bacterium]|nr:DUF4442 domain-containing protein [Thiotrichales bacterium]
MFWLNKFLPESLSGTLGLRYFGWRHIPLLFYCRPALVACDNEKVTVSIALKRRTRNHLGSMYFGALCVGADCAAGLIAMQRVQQSGEKVSLIFKSLSADFLQRVEGDAYFHCEQGRDITALVSRAIMSGERVEMPVRVYVTVPSVSAEVVAEFELVLSLKRR